MWQDSNREVRRKHLANNDRHSYMSQLASDLGNLQYGFSALVEEAEKNEVPVFIGVINTGDHKVLHLGVDKLSKGVYFDFSDLINFS